MQPLTVLYAATGSSSSGTLLPSTVDATAAANKLREAARRASHGLRQHGQEGLPTPRGTLGAGSHVPPCEGHSGRARRRGAVSRLQRCHQLTPDTVRQATWFLYQVTGKTMSTELKLQTERSRGSGLSSRWEPDPSPVGCHSEPGDVGAGRPGD